MSHITGVGTVFSRVEPGDTSSTYVALSQILTICGPGMSRETVDTTALDTQGGYRTFITGFRDGGELTYTMSFLREHFDILKADFEIDDPVEYKISLQDDELTEISFSGLVTGFPMSIPPDEKVTCDVTIKISGTVDVDSGV